MTACWCCGRPVDVNDLDEAYDPLEPYGSLSDPTLCRACAMLGCQRPDQLALPLEEPA